MKRIEDHEGSPEKPDITTRTTTATTTTATTTTATATTKARQSKTEVKFMQSNTAKRQRIEVAASCCSICGSEAVVFDEVLDEPALLLGECLHCEYRWTRSGSPPWSEWRAARATLDPSPALAGVRLAPKIPNAA